MKKLIYSFNSNVFVFFFITLFKLYTMLTQLIKAQSLLLFATTYDWGRFATVLILCLLVVRVSLQMDTLIRKAKLMQLVSKVRLWKMFNQDVDYSNPRQKMEDFLPTMAQEKEAVKKLWHKQHNQVNQKQLEADLQDIYK